VPGVSDEQYNSSDLQEHLKRGESLKRFRDTENAYRNQDEVAAATDCDEHRPRASQKSFAENENVLGTRANEKAQGKQKALHGSGEVEHVGEPDNLSS
jgi:hypothetical protein